LAHVHPTKRPYHLPESGKPSASKAHRDGVADRCAAPAVPQSLAIDLALSPSDDQLLNDGALSLVTAATPYDAHTLSLRPTVPGIGTIRSRVRLSAMSALARCPTGQDVVSSGRLVTCAQESAGKRVGTAGTTSGTAPLQWACADAAALCRRHHPAGPPSGARVATTHGQGNALTSLAHQRARAV